MIQFLLAAFRDIYDEIGVPPVVVRLLIDALGVTAQSRELRDVLVELRKRAEAYDALPDGWSTAEDAEMRWGMPLRGHMLEWVADEDKMRFAYVEGKFTPILNAAHLFALFGEPKCTSVSIEAREAGCSYVAMYQRARAANIPFKFIKGWRGDMKKVFNKKAFDWEKDFWRMNGHISNARLKGREMTGVDADMQKAQHGYMVADGVLKAMYARKKANEHRIKKLTGTSTKKQKQIYG